MDIDPLPSLDALLCVIQASTDQTITQFGFGNIIAIICACFALCVSAFVSGSEIAFFSLTHEQIESIEEEDPEHKALKLLRKPENLLATILIANNLVNVTIVVFLNYALSPIFDRLGSVVSFLLQSVILTFLILLFGEILPKLMANTNNLRWVKRCSGAVNVLTTILKPISSLLVHSSVIVNRVVTKRDDELSARDLSDALEITDVRASDQKEMLEGILKFGDTTACEIMTPRVDITDLDISSSFSEVMKVVIDSGYARLPVYDKSQDDIKGVLYSRDLLPYVDNPESDFNWQKLLREPYYVPESRMIDDLLEDFRRRHIHMAIVIDEFGGTQGIVTLEDVLEEIVGDINDEYDEEEKTYKRLPDDTFVFDGKTLLGDFFRITDLDEADYQPVAEDCETLAGMLLAIKGDFPKEKESLVYGRCRFLVLDIANHRIASVRVKVMDDIQQPQPAAR